MNPSEIAGVVFGIAYVWLAIRESPWCWPFGIANAALFVVVFAHARLYGQAGLNSLYVALSIYGWYEWLHGGEGRGRLAVTRMPGRWAVALAGVVIAASASFGVALKLHTDAALPFSDAATTCVSLAAQWMTTRKWLESWLVWVAVDAVYVVLCLSQRLHLTAGLYLLFLVMAVLGYRGWRAALQSGAAA